MRLTVKQLKKIIKEAASFVPSPGDTARIDMTWKGPELWFGTQSFQSWRSIGDVEPTSMQQAAQFDIATARQTIDDLISMPEIRFVVDAENNGDNVPMPVDQYIRDTQAYIDSMKREAGVSEGLTQAKLGISSPHRAPPGPSVQRTCAECGNQWSSSQALYKGYNVPERCSECGSNDVVSAAGPKAPDSGFDMSAHATGKAARNLIASLD